MPHETETNQQTGTSGPDAIDQLLNNAFDQAFAATADVDLVDIIMARIAREQRNRFIVLSVLGIVGTLLLILAGLPVLNLVGSMVSGLAGGAVGGADGLADWQSNLPVIVLALAAAVGGAWLLLEESL